MAALTSTRSTWVRAISTVQAPLPTSYTATEGGAACIDTANLGAVYPAVSGSTTLIPIGKFVSSVKNTSGSNINVSVKLDQEVWVRNWDSVTGGGAVTISNQFAVVYMSSDHEVTTTSTSNSKAGRVWDVNGDGVWVEQPWAGQSST